MALTAESEYHTQAQELAYQGLRSVHLGILISFNLALLSCDTS